MSTTHDIAECVDNAERLAQQTGLGVAPDRAEQRRHTRYEYERELTISWAGTFDRRGETMSVQSKDISAGGMRLLSRHMMYPGSRGVVRLTRPDGTSALVGLEVVHTSYVGNMRYASGCRFIPIPDNVLARVLERGGRANDRRSGDGAPEGE